MNLKIGDTPLPGLQHLQVELHRVTDGEGRVHARQAVATLTAVRSLTVTGHASIAALQALAKVSNGLTITLSFTGPAGEIRSITLEDVMLDSVELETQPNNMGSPTEIITASAGKITDGDKTYTRDYPLIA